MQIDGSDGVKITSGRSGNSRRLDVSARGDTRMFYISRDAGQAYSWSGMYNSANDDTVMLVKNTSTSLVLVIIDIEVSNDAATRIRIHLPTSEVTPAGGTLITGVNLNTQSTNAAQAIARQDETSNALGDIIEDFLIGANSPHEASFEHGLRLGQNKSVAVDMATGASTIGGATVIGYFEVPGT